MGFVIIHLNQSSEPKHDKQYCIRKIISIAVQSTYLFSVVETKNIGKPGSNEHLNNLLLINNNSHIKHACDLCSIYCIIYI